MSTLEVTELTGWIRGRLAAEGMAHLREPVTEEEFTAIAAGLGTLQMRTDLKVDPQKDAEQRRTRTGFKAKERPGVYRASELAFHADRPTVDVLAWYCVDQDELDGSLQLIDTADLAEHLGAAELEALARIPVSYALRHPETQEESWHQAPLAVATGEGRHRVCDRAYDRDGVNYRVYYAPWLVPTDLDEPRARALAAFAAYLERKERESRVSIRLAPGESLFIDNHRMLHGRGPLMENSRRHIVRYYVGEPERP